MTTPHSEAAKTTHPWSKDAYLAKAQRYAQEMLKYPRDSWQFGLTSTFVLEFLARAALASINPTLLADSKNWHNLYYALGETPNSSKFSPKSIDLNEALNRLHEIVPTFTSDIQGFAREHINRRNEELHAGSTPFDGLNALSANWLARFYEVSTILISSIGESLTILVK